MKPLFVFSIVLTAGIIMAASFGLHIQPIDPSYNLAPDVAANALYVCPAADQIWDSISQALRPNIVYVSMFFFLAIMLLMFAWGWALYQNLLEDKFKEKNYKDAWYWTKAVFWLAVVAVILVWTPNNYRKVKVIGADGNYVLCEANTPGALPVRASSVKR